MEDLLRNCYDPAAFRKQGHKIVDLLADHLERLEQTAESRVIPEIDPQAELDYWKEDFATARGTDDLWSRLIERSIQLHHPRYMGHQIARPAYIAGLSAMLADVLNNGMGVFEMGPGATALEQLIIEQVCRRIGYPESSGGFLTSGGTLANLTALLAARQALSGEVWENGSAQQLAIMVSEEAHYCVERAVRVMGWGSRGIIKIPANTNYQMDTSLLEPALTKAQQEGIRVIAVVGSACSTSTGSYDDLEAIRDFCARHQLWFHVDGAHGGAAIFSSPYRHLVKGMEQADSVVMDFHKMLMSPALVTALLFKSTRSGFRTFSQQAQYLWDREEELEWFNLAKRTFECTKSMMSVKVYAILRQHGFEAFDALVSTLYDLGATFAHLIQEREHLELAVPPQSNIVCFRYHPPGMEEKQLNAINAAIRKAIVADGQYYIVQTLLRGRLFLRTSLMNPATGRKEMEGLLELVERLGKRVKAK